MEIADFGVLQWRFYNDEERLDDVKEAIMVYLENHKDEYLACNWLTDGDAARLENIPLHRGKCGQEHYFTDPECSQLAADTFERPIEFHEPAHTILYLPFIGHTSYKAYRPFVLNLYDVETHIYYVIMKRRNYGYPPIKYTAQYHL